MGDLPQGVLIIGSVPLKNVEEVFRTCGKIVGTRLVSLPDGETGGRLSWLGHQRARFDRHPQLQLLNVGNQGSALYHFKEGTKLHFESLGYSDFARDSYTIFERMQAEGIVPRNLRFQVSLPTPLNLLSFFDPDQGQEVESALIEAFRREIRTMISHILPEKLALQWDMPREVAILRGLQPAGSPDPLTRIISMLNNISAAIPESTLLGMHLCCGDRHYRPIQELDDLGVLVRLANVLAERLEHRLDWVQMPVPPERDDLNYFRPLGDLEIGTGKLFLGLVHYRDGTEGALRRIETARKLVAEFGVTTECGLGRRNPETIPDLLKTLAQVSTPMS
jgi:hypothetical protein